MLYKHNSHHQKYSHSSIQSTFADIPYLLSACIRFAAARTSTPVAWKHTPAARTCSVAARTQPPATRIGRPSSTLGPAHWTQQGLAHARPFGCFLHKVYRLLKFFILLGKGLHPFDQLVALLDSPSYPLQAHNGNDELRSPTSKTRIPDAVLTLICFITPARVDFNLLISLVVSSSSTTTTSSPHLWRIQIDWG